jgi:hypothetical protein
MSDANIITVPTPQPRETFPAQFVGELMQLLNKHSIDNALHTPDFVLSNYIVGCLSAYKAAREENKRWEQGGPES